MSWPGEPVVISWNAPGQLGSTMTVGKRVMTVVGVANSVTNTADAWVLPAEMNAIAGSAGSGQAQLLYRFSSNATSTDIASGINEVKAALPPRAVSSPISYLVVRTSEQSGVAPLGAVHHRVRRDLTRSQERSPGPTHDRGSGKRCAPRSQWRSE